jgi:hypothetical protein
MAATVVSQSNTESVPNLAVLRITTDAGGAAVTTFQVGFLPRVVRLMNITDNLMDEWFDGMAADTAIHTVAAGTRSLLGSGGITVGSTAGGGFVTLAAALIIASKTFNMVVEG